MKVAVVGGGIFGVTIAIRLAQHGHEVNLFEKNESILQAASSINQYRLHRGYHYPRSADTILSSRDASDLFEKEYKEAVITDFDHYYAIAREGSKTSPKRFIEICKSHGLDFSITDLDIVDNDAVSLVVRAQEHTINPHKLKELCEARLKQYRVNVRFNTVATPEDLESYDKVILATYASLNSLLQYMPEKKRRYQYELCEKIVVRLPERFKGKCLVIMDGPFSSLDPYGKTGLFVMGHVVHAIHHTNVGESPEIDPQFEKLLNRGVIENPPITNFIKFIESAARFIPGIIAAEHIGSMYTVRTVLPYQDATDTRPTIVEELNDKFITVFSGKLGNAVPAANGVLRIVGSKIPVISRL